MDSEGQLPGSPHTLQIEMVGLAESAQWGGRSVYA